MRRVPLSVKLIYTAWMAVWIPVYWTEAGPQNFLWLCDVANFLVGLALWLESRSSCPPRPWACSSSRSSGAETTSAA